MEHCSLELSAKTIRGRSQSDAKGGRHILDFARQPKDRRHATHPRAPHATSGASTILARRQKADVARLDPSTLLSSRDVSFRCINAFSVCFMLRADFNRKAHDERGAIHAA